MTDAFKKLFLGLGGDAKELAENNDVGDYIEDLEGAIKAYVDEAAGEGKELPTPAVDDIGKVVSVVSDGESGAEYALETPASGGNVEVINLLFSNQVFSLPEGKDNSYLASAINNGIEIVLHDTVNNVFAHLTEMTSGPGGKKYLTFMCLQDGGSANNMAVHLYKNTSSTNITYTSKTLSYT